MDINTIRTKFIEYFKKNNHSVIASSHVIPHNDPTLLFTNAGMNQFKDVFLGSSIRDYKCAVSSQKCLRAGGKHNDLENVGHTTRHCTFFEMLGNFSFGDYFKKKAIQFSWEVTTEVFGFNPDRIYPSVFQGDKEAFELWTNYVPVDKICRFGEKENFWSMGDTGPCGPCSELLYDRGPKYGNATSPIEDSTGERFLEFWNLVFMQYNRDESGIMHTLPKPSIDTGAGLERIAMLSIGGDSVFQVDIFRSIIAEIEKLTSIKYESYTDKHAPAFHVIADHLRALVFAITDGAQPSNIDRGYVLRKILRRAVRYGRSLGIMEPFLANLLPCLVSEMGDHYKELRISQQRVAEILTLEEESFIRTLRRGGDILDNIVKHASQHDNIISGDDAFKLKDTYGFPLEEILLIARDANVTIDKERYNILEKQAKDLSRSAHKSTQQIASENLFATYAKTQDLCKFIGYDSTQSVGIIKALVIDDKFVEKIHQGQNGLIILDKTPFYAESGGQVGDNGSIIKDDHIFIVEDCQSPYTGIIVHIGKLEKGTLNLGDKILAQVNKERHQKIANNHTATHLLHWALHKVLGEHVKQTGSIVESHRLRFDFSHHKCLSSDEIEQIENLINEKIRDNDSVSNYEIDYDKAQKSLDIKQFFGDKYGSKVRVVDIGYSKELCGGSHTTRVGTIGFFRIVKEGSISAGVRRIEGVTGHYAEAFVKQNEQILTDIASMLKTQPNKIINKIKKLLEENKDISLELKSIKKSIQKDLIGNLVSKYKTINGIPIIIDTVELDSNDLKSVINTIMSKFSSVILAIVNVINSTKCQFIIKVSDDLVMRGFKANEIIKPLAPIIQGNGGGKSNYAQAGGVPQNINQLLDETHKLIEDMCLKNS